MAERSFFSFVIQSLYVLELIVCLYFIFSSLAALDLLLYFLYTAMNSSFCSRVHCFLLPAIGLSLPPKGKACVFVCLFDNLCKFPLGVVACSYYPFLSLTFLERILHKLSFDTAGRYILLFFDRKCKLFQPPHFHPFEMVSQAGANLAHNSLAKLEHVRFVERDWLKKKNPFKCYCS